ncbi:hypothetical protein ACFZAT_08745 [Streptomyces sp. NPDC008163]|uniref:hypothetical protein n=1 Tax=Streptomyces sp. NPDC008163 TaxID=3364818 RepID=UPI0036EA971C
MDLQGVGAIAAAAVAAVSVPAAIVVGRWQLRAALRAAEEAGRAGLAQAEATYRAALDAVRAEASHTQTQWRRGIQREAFVSHLLAARKAAETAKRMNESYVNKTVSIEETERLRVELWSARTAVRNTSLIVSLEAPGELATASERIDYWTGELVASLDYQVEMFEAERKVRLRADQEAQDGDAHRPNGNLVTKLVLLRSAVEEHAPAGGQPFEVAQISPEIEAARNAVQDAMNAVVLELTERVALEELQCNLGGVMREAREAEEELQAWEEDFLRLAREALDGSAHT